MYIPKTFQVDDPQRLYRFIRENSFGILFSGNDGQLMATHLPLERQQRTVKHLKKSETYDSQKIEEEMAQDKRR